MHRGPIKVYPRCRTLRLTVAQQQRLAELARTARCSGAEVLRRAIMSPQLLSILGSRDALEVYQEG